MGMSEWRLLEPRVERRAPAHVGVAAAATPTYSGTAANLFSEPEGEVKEEMAVSGV